jgi:hypothetical protein
VAHRIIISRVMIFESITLDKIHCKPLFYFVL